MLFLDRGHGGRLLASKLRQYKDTEALVLAIPRGGIPVAFEIAKSLNLPMDVLAVRKIGAPFNPELALGAICEDILPVLSDSLLGYVNMTSNDLSEIVEIEKKEIQRQIKKFRQGRDLKNLKDKTIIVVDDGLATGATVLAAAKYLRAQKVAKIVVAVPIASGSSVRKLKSKVDDFVVIEESEDLLSVSYWYQDFAPVEDRRATFLLKSHMGLHAQHP